MILPGNLGPGRSWEVLGGPGRSYECIGSHRRSWEAPELLYSKFMRKEQTSLPALVLKRKSRHSSELLRFY